MLGEPVSALLIKLGWREEDPEADIISSIKIAENPNSALPSRSYLVLAHTVMAYTVMAYTVMSCMVVVLFRFGPYRYDPYCYGLYSYGVYSYGLYSYGQRIQTVAPFEVPYTIMASKPMASMAMADEPNSMLSSSSTHSPNTKIFEGSLLGTFVVQIDMLKYVAGWHAQGGRQ